MKDAYQRIPLMFRAQLEGRCQIQRLNPDTQKQDAQIWAEEWTKSVAENLSNFSNHVRTKSYEISWRFITNSGQDEDVIRPVIGANGFPYYPGSSMKGAFLRACPQGDRLKYCGGNIGKETQPGILRFHGGYPQDLDWADADLVDIVHPQEKWQTQIHQTGQNNKPKGESGFIQISLYQPTLVFGISCNQELPETEWEKIWMIWEKALSQGIGTRVSAGYGQVKLNKESRTNSILSVSLKGQGLASTLIDKTIPEFRPNGFKAALRGHTMRLLGGVTDEKTAEKLTKQLWGGFGGSNGAIVGQLGITFEEVKVDSDSDTLLDTFDYTPGRNLIEMPIYNLKNGVLDILAMGNLTEKRQNNLKIFLTRLIKFSLLLGGFGKSWRRVDHRLFMPDYLDNDNKPMIGCHWQFIEQSRSLYIPVNRLEDVTTFLNEIHQKAKDWVTYNKEQLSLSGCNWREAFNHSKVQVWGRIAENQDDSLAIDWFHGQYAKNKTIKQSPLTGKLGQIGRIWHRMYPRWLVVDGKRKSSCEFVELLTIFPDDSQQTKDFLSFLRKTDFQKLW